MTNYMQVENLTKSFGDNLLFENISFTITDNQRVALIAKNGAGKTTLLNIIADREGYDSGNIFLKRDLRIGYLDQSPDFPKELSVIDACLQTDNDIVRTIAEYEHVMLHPDKDKMIDVLARMGILKAWDYETRIKQILGKLKITDFEQKIGNLSGGQLKRVALANVLISEPDLLILDEPTNHLDLEMVEWLEEFLKRSTMSLLMVTHDRYFLDRVCNTILEIDNQSLYSYSGNYSYYLEKRQERIDTFNAETESVKTFTAANWNGCEALLRHVRTNHGAVSTVLRTLKNGPNRICLLITSNLALNQVTSVLKFSKQKISAKATRILLFSIISITPLPATKKWVLSGKTEQEKPLF